MHDFSCYAESLSTLQFADSAKRIKNNAVVNENVIGQGIAQLQAEILRLKEENRRLIQLGTSSPGRFDILEGQGSSQNLSSVSEAELLRLLAAVNKLEKEKNVSVLHWEDLYWFLFLIHSML